MGLRGRDAYGSGKFGASRKRNGKKDTHRGADFLSRPGQAVTAPVAGRIIRFVQRVYRDDSRFQGIVIETTGGFTITLFYVSPAKALLGKDVMIGDPIGLAQDLVEKYPDKGMGAISNHVHVQVLEPGGAQFANPEKLLKKVSKDESE
jgi:hypothetical protein